MITLSFVWFVLLGVLLTVYAVLDGFDLGVGVLHPFLARKEPERRALLAAIGPFWDGNEVWLLTGGGAMFAAFPVLYAAVFSGFYLAMMLVLLGLILRAVSLEFRGKVESRTWRTVWDWGFWLGSLLPALLYGVAVGNVAQGVPLDERFEFAGTFLGLLNPFALAVGLLGLSMFIVHGALYIALKTEEPLAGRARRTAHIGWFALVALYGVVTVMAVVFAPERFVNFAATPLAVLVPALAIMVMASTYLAMRRGDMSRAFLCSAGTIIGLMGIFGVSLYPVVLPASNDAANSLTAFNAASSPLTLRIMLILVAIGLPLVVAYTYYVYRIFRGKVRLTGEGY